MRASVIWPAVPTSLTWNTSTASVPEVRTVASEIDSCAAREYMQATWACPLDRNAKLTRGAPSPAAPHLLRLQVLGKVQQQPRAVLGGDAAREEHA
jgi:hypothetical protein